MSLIEITDHNEVIYRILYKPPPSPPLTPRYESNLERELKRIKVVKCCRTMGYAETPLDPPSEFLRKGAGIVPPVKKCDHKCVKGDLPGVPRHDQVPTKQKRPEVNFRVVNIKKAIKTKGKRVEPRLVDTRDGHIKTLHNSGEVPQFSRRPDFGQLPKYLVRFNNKKRRQIQKIQWAEEQKKSLCKLVSDQERQDLLKDLKTNWALMQKAFLQLPMLTDTIPKIMKKTKMEEDLKQLEKDIALVEMNPYIYVFDKQMA